MAHQPRKPGYYHLAQRLNVTDPDQCPLRQESQRLSV